MQKDVIEKIDLLVAMSGTTNSYEPLQEELLQLEKQIENKKNQVRNLKKSISENTYIKASDRIIDENIKISIENKIQYYQDSLEDLLSQLKGFSQEEMAIHSSIISLEEEKKQLESFFSSLELKLKTIGKKDKSVYHFYEELIDKTKNDLDKNNSLLSDYQTKYEQVCDKLEQFGNRRGDVEESLQKEQERLKEINQFLASPTSYVDQKAKQNDEKLIDQFTSQLEEMERRRLEILTDPSFIAHDAVMLMVDEKEDKALEKVRELVTIVKSRPFMEYDKTDLEELLERTINERDGLATQLENKIYSNKELMVVETRLKFLEERKKELLEEIHSLEEKIKNMDVVSVKSLMEYVEESKACRDSLQEDIDEYKKVISSHQEFKTPKKEASLRAALKKKEEEYIFVNQLVLSFEKDLENLVIRSRNLEEKTLQELTGILENIEVEIKDIQKNQVLMNSSKDILAVEKDKENLKKLNDDVHASVHRQEFEKMPDEIYDEIELLLGSMTPLEPQKNSEPDDFVNLSDYRIDLDSSNEDSVIDDSDAETSIPEPVIVEENVDMDPMLVEEDNPLEPVFMEEMEDALDSLPVTEEQNDDSIIFEPVKENEVSVIEEGKNNLEFSSEEPKEKVNNRFKVIRVEPLTLDVQDMEKLDSDTENIDDEYISFNNLLEGDEDGNKD